MLKKAVQLDRMGAIAIFLNAEICDKGVSVLTINCFLTMDCSMFLSQASGR
ncbi:MULTISPECIES: hypothetical protein [unclassified Nostoc]|uniref:hypothetical protein n=1 Tax=unclassified Nostoc TaxID=2593658 RepID=UPI00159F3260|nr:hypothetical protein [Nostoc sp. KVJ20]